MFDDDRTVIVNESSARVLQRLQLVQASNVVDTADVPDIERRLEKIRDGLLKIDESVLMNKAEQIDQDLFLLIQITAPETAF